MAWHHRFRHYVGLEKEAAKLSRLLAQFRFTTTLEVLQTSGWRVPFFNATDHPIAATA